MLLKKEEGKIPRYQVNEDEIGSLSEKELKSNDSKDDPTS